MVSLDFRTRTDADIRSLDARALLRRGAAGADRRPRPRSRSPVRASWASSRSRSRRRRGTWTLALDDVERDACEPGDDGVARVELSDADVADVVNDLKTPMTFLTAGTLRMTRGNLGELPRLVGRAAFADRRPPGAHARRGRRSRTATDRRSTCTARSRPTTTTTTSRTFLAEAGFLHLRGWFDAGRDARDLRRHGPRASRPTRATTAVRGGRRPRDGDDRCVRMEYFHEHSDARARAARRANGSCASAGSSKATTCRARPATASKRS